ncbi:hypothetical protein ACFLVU_00990 [Chloroflexota bacterium]
MNLLGLLKKKYAKILEQRDAGVRVRHQLNMEVDVRLPKTLKRLAAEFTVPRDRVGEHVLETGCYYVTKVTEDEEKMKFLRRHLTNSHLVDDGTDDSEAILRLGEGGDISKLLVQIQPVLRSWRIYKQAAATAEKTGNLYNFKKCQEKLMEAAIRLAYWVEKHGVDQPRNERIQNSRQEDDPATQQGTEDWY